LQSLAGNALQEEVSDIRVVTTALRHQIKNEHVGEKCATPPRNHLEINCALLMLAAESATRFHDLMAP